MPDADQTLVGGREPSTGTMTKNANPRGAEALSQALHTAGVRRLFTLSGSHIMSVFDAASDAGIELVHTRHEASAVHMADDWSRITGEVGIALVTGGPGHAKEMRQACQPVVIRRGMRLTELT